MRWLLAAIVLLCAILPTAAPAQKTYLLVKPSFAANPIKHVVVIVQENRTVDNFFNGFPGANTVTTGQISTGATVTLSQHASTATSWDPGHAYGDFINDCNNLLGLNSSQCLMTGFDLNSCQGACGDGAPYPSMWFTQAQAVVPLWTQATVNGELNDETFESAETPSLVSHAYVAQSNSRLANGNPTSLAGNMASGTAGCENVGNSVTINLASPWPSTPQIYSGTGGNGGGCSNDNTIMALFDANGISYKILQGSLTPTGDQALWAFANNNAGYCQPVAGVCTGASFTQNVVAVGTDGTESCGNTQAQFSAMVNSLTLPQVTWLVPCNGGSDHPNLTKDTGGPNYVNSIINCLGGFTLHGPSICLAERPYWNNTVVIVYWDDWGGWYDHVPPPTPPAINGSTDPLEYGPRVPLMVVGAYARSPGTVDHTVGDQSCVNKFLLNAFGLAGPISSDSIEVDCTNDFRTTLLNYNQNPRPPVFVPYE